VVEGLGGRVGLDGCLAHRGASSAASAADEIVDGHKAPLVRVEAVGRIVAEHEVVSVGNQGWLAIAGKAVAGGEVDVRLVKPFAIDEYPALGDQDRFAREADDALM